MKYKRIFAIVLDSFGVGHAIDKEKYGDSIANTALNIDMNVNGLHVPTLEKLGFGHLDSYIGIKPINDFIGYVGRLSETSNGKDTMTGHWEMMGINTKVPFKVFTDTGFPKELIDLLEEKTGHKIIGNKSASGTEIIKEYGERQLETNELIVYTSSDSVLQIAANEALVPVEKLYEYCEIARDITMKEEWKVGRIIARPFIGTTKDNFKRTPKRHDYALSPSNDTYLDLLLNNGYSVISVGKIADIFNNKGIGESNKTVSNEDGMNKTIEIVRNKDFTGLCFINLVDFDMEYGHRRNIEGYAKCLEDFDKQLAELIPLLKDDDLLILTADHGNDPTAPGSDHTREEVPFILYSPSFKEGKLIEKGNSFGNIGATIAANFGLSDDKLLGKNIL